LPRLSQGDLRKERREQRYDESFELSPSFFLPLNPRLSLQLVEMSDGHVEYHTVKEFIVFCVYGIGTASLCDVCFMYEWGIGSIVVHYSLSAKLEEMKHNL
jgi:hypothetical protein